MRPGPPHNKKYLSIHIPKTAGVSIRNILKEHFGPGFVQYYWQITDAWGRVVDKVPSDATCVHGHYHADKLARLFPGARLITWVRDPVERVISSYHHQLREPDMNHSVCRELHDRKLSLTEYATLPLMRNEMTRYFGSKKPEDFLFIGIVEEFEPSLAVMAELLGFAVPRPRRDNVNPEKPADRYELDPAVRREILAVNEQDADLYADCLRRWGRQTMDRCG